MCTHEEKYCPRCNKAFECRVGNITRCQCYGITLSDVERAYTESLFSDCLCRACLLQVKNDFALLKNPSIPALKKNR